MILYHPPMDDAEAARAQQLLDEGASKFAGLWDDAASMIRHAEHPAYHDPRGTLAYARMLLEAGDIARAEAAIRAVLALQETRRDDAHCGNFRWMLEDECVTDLNGVEFMLDGLIPLLREYADALSGDTATAMREAIALGLNEIDRLDVHVSYTNIYLSDVCNSVLGGELLVLHDAGGSAGDDDAPGGDYYIERGRQRLDDWFAFTANSGAPHEYNSPTYMGVDLARLAALAEHTADSSIGLRARVAEELVWLHVAAHYHPLLAQLAGPHSRAYFDGATGAGGLLKLALWRLLGDDALRPSTPYAARTREEGHTGVAREPLHCPPYVLEWLRAKRYPFDTAETVDPERGNDITTHMTADYALGTAARAYGVGEPPEPWPGANSLLLYFRRDEAPGYGTLTTRYIINDKGLGSVVYESSRVAEDLWEEGQFVGAQNGGLAIVAYGLYPRLRPARSYKLSVRMLGAGDTTEVWVGDRRIDAYPATVQPGESVVIAEGGAYIAMLPLAPTDMGHDAPIELNHDGHLLTLDIYNYRGPDKTFWEHRSQSGPFYQGNVRNAFALEVAGKDEYDGVAAFRAHIATARLADSVGEGNVRSITYASGERSVGLRYSLADMRVLERRYDGDTYVAPKARAGSRDGAGPRYTISDDNVIAIGRLRLLAGATRAVFADDDAGRYVVLKFLDDETPLLIETPNTMIECDDIGFARIEIDEDAATITIEADGLLGTIRTPDGRRLIINGTDVTDSMTTAADGIREFHGLG